MPPAHLRNGRVCTVSLIALDDITYSLAVVPYDAMNEDIKLLREALKAANLCAEEGEVLAAHTTFRIGGPADLYLEAWTELELQRALSIVNQCSTPAFLLGGGSNLLIRDGGMAGLVIHDRTNGWSLNGNELTVSSGQWLTDVVETISKNGIGGIEYLAGIPGTLGGAACGNAGAYGQDISSSIVSLRVLVDGKFETITPDDLDYGYRTSLLKRSVSANGLPQMVVTSATLRVNCSPTSDPAEKVREILEHRQGRLPPKSLGCAGSYFKNLPSLEEGGRRRAAGMLLDQTGVKGLTVGNAQVFLGHANIIVNKGDAKPATFYS